MSQVARYVFHAGSAHVLARAAGEKADMQVRNTLTNVPWNCPTYSIEHIINLDLQ